MKASFNNLIPGGAIECFCGKGAIHAESLQPQMNGMLLQYVQDASPDSSTSEIRTYVDCSQFTFGWHNRAKAYNLRIQERDHHPLFIACNGSPELLNPGLSDQRRPLVQNVRGIVLCGSLVDCGEMDFCHCWSIFFGSPSYQDLLSFLIHERPSATLLVPRPLSHQK